MQNSCTGSLRASTLPIGHECSPHDWIFTSERGKTFRFIETWISERGSNTRSPIFQAGIFNLLTTGGHPLTVSIKQLSNFHQLEVVGRGSETQLQAGENLN